MITDRGYQLILMERPPFRIAIDIHVAATRGVLKLAELNTSDPNLQGERTYVEPVATRHRHT